MCTPRRSKSWAWECVFPFGVMTLGASSASIIISCPPSLLHYTSLPHNHHTCTLTSTTTSTTITFNTNTISFIHTWPNNHFAVLRIILSSSVTFYKRHDAPVAINSRTFIQCHGTSGMRHVTYFLHRQDTLNLIIRDFPSLRRKILFVKYT